MNILILQGGLHQAPNRTAISENSRCLQKTSRGAWPFDFLHQRLPRYVTIIIYPIKLSLILLTDQDVNLLPKINSTCLCILVCVCVEGGDGESSFDLMHKHFECKHSAFIEEMCRLIFIIVITLLKLWHSLVHTTEWVALQWVSNPLALLLQNMTVRWCKNQMLGTIKTYW